VARITYAQREQIRRLAADGVSVRKTAAAMGLSAGTVQRYRATSAAAPMVRAEPFGATPQPPANVPPPAWNTDQPKPPPKPLRFDLGYHGHTFKSYAAPQSFEGWSVDRIRNAVALHDQGMFLESSMLALVASRFGPVFAALGQAIAPALALPRHVNGGTRGLARVLRDEVETQIAPRAGLLPSAYFPPTLWGSIQLDLAQMGFCVLQHAYGDPDPDTGVMQIYTRRWPTWAVQYYRYRRTYVALTSEGPVDIISGDGKFTLIGDTEEPHFEGAIRAAALEVLDGTLVKQARASYVDKYGNPKWVGFMPPNVGTYSDEGNAFFRALETIQGPNGFGALPHGSEYEVAEMSSSQSTVFKDALDNVWQYVAAIYLGSDGTMTRGTGVYSAPIFAGVRRDIVDRRLKAMTRGVNHGHIAPYLQFNYSVSIELAGGWVDPVVDIPLPDPDADARIKSYSDRMLALTVQVKAERDSGFVVTQERVNVIAEKLDVEPPLLEAASAPADPASDAAPGTAPTEPKSTQVDAGEAAA
jgi:hypothetical protein